MKKKRRSGCHVGGGPPKSEMAGSCAQDSPPLLSPSPARVWIYFTLFFLREQDLSFHSKREALEEEVKK